MGAEFRRATPYFQSSPVQSSFEMEIRRSSDEEEEEEMPLNLVVGSRTGFLRSGRRLLKRRRGPSPSADDEGDGSGRRRRRRGRARARGRGRGRGRSRSRTTAVVEPRELSAAAENGVGGGAESGDGPAEDAGGAESGDGPAEDAGGAESGDGPAEDAGEDGTEVRGAPREKPSQPSRRRRLRSGRTRP